MARKARNFPTSGMKPDKESPEIERNESKTCSTALYIRLSKEDGGKNNSNSILNQKAVLMNFISEKEEFNLYSVYIDNGYSGTNFERPAFQKMIADMKLGRINCIIVKDLSRLGRSYLESGNYLEKVFPFYHVRFIAVNDGVDSLQTGTTEEDIMIPLKNIINDIYAKDISRKISSSIESGIRAGHYAGGVAPYGYKKVVTERHSMDERYSMDGRHSMDERRFLEVDEEAAAVVKKIFEMRAKGDSYQQIVRRLNEKGSLSPSAYRYEKGIIRNEKRKEIPWKRHSIENMLRDEVYLGNMVRGKTKSAHYKGQKRHRIGREDWIIIKGTHEAIISEELFWKVQNIKK